MKTSHIEKIHICCWIIFFFFTGVSCSDPSFKNPDDWPTKEWRMSTPEEQGMKSDILADMLDFVQNNGFKIDSISIVRNGYLVLDAYFYPFSRDQKHIIHSCTKSIMSALIGIAIDKGYIKSVNQPIMEFFPDRTFSNLDEAKQSITLENLLTMASGLKTRDSYSYRWAGLGEMSTSDDWAQYILDLPMAERPGEKFKYSNGVSYLLSVIIQETTNLKTLDFAQKNLFGPLGITDIEWKTSPQGIDFGWGQMRLKPHDMAKIGWLYLNKGQWDNKQIVPSEWVEASTRGHIDAPRFDRYGYQWWISSAGYYIAVGFGGQRIFVLPDKNIVAVFTSHMSPRRPFSKIPNRLLNSYIIPAASSKPLRSNPKKKARLETILGKISKRKVFTWFSEKEGIAKDGVFKRAASPAFKFEYPLGSNKVRVRSFPDDRIQVMRMGIPGYLAFSATIGNIPYNLKLVDFVPKFVASELQNVVSNVQIISNNETTLKCGTMAYETDFKWLSNYSIPTSGRFVSAYKDGKYVVIATHSGWQFVKERASIIKSLEFE